MANNETRIVITADGQQASVTLEKLSGLLGDVKNRTEEATEASKRSWGDFATGLNQAMEATMKFASMAKSVINFAREGAEFAEAKANFQAYAAAVGQSSGAILRATREATKGQVDDLQLIRGATRAMQMGITTDIGALARLWEIAEAKGDQFGKGIQETFDIMVKGIGEGNGKLLLELGLVPASLMKAHDSAELLTNRVELLKTVLEQGGIELQTLAGVGNSAADDFARLDAAATNLKRTFSEELLPAIIPLVQELGRLTEGMVEFLRARNLLSAGPNPFAGQSGGALESALDRGKKDLARWTGKAGRLEGAYQELFQQGRYGESNALLPALRTAERTRDTTAEAVRQMEEALRVARAMDAQMVEVGGKLLPPAEAARVREGLKEIHAGHAKAGRASAEHGKAVKDLFTEYDRLMKKAADFPWSARMAGLMSATAPGAISFDAEGMVRTAERINGEIEKAREILVGLADDFADELGGVEDAILDAFEEGDRGGDALVKGIGDSIERSGTAIEQPLSRVFNDAFVAGLNGGNFWDALRNGLKRTFIEALSNQLTGALFGQSGGITGILGGSGGGGSGGILGGIFKPVTNKGGGINWGNLGTNLAIGGALSWLTSPGRLFGGTVTHGGEVPGQAADINAQVTQALKDRDAFLMSAVGLTRETYDLIRGIRFQGASYTWEKSGDGIFSKKTKTYQLDSAAASASLQSWADAQQKAIEEMSKRSFEISMTELSDPLQALAMRIADLREAVGMATQANEKAYDLQLELARAEKQKEQEEKARQANWGQFAIGTAGFLNKELLTKAPSQTGVLPVGDPNLRWRTQLPLYKNVFDPYSDQNGRMYSRDDAGDVSFGYDTAIGLAPAFNRDSGWFSYQQRARLGRSIVSANWTPYPNMGDVWGNNSERPNPFLYFPLPQTETPREPTPIPEPIPIPVPPIIPPTPTTTEPVPIPIPVGWTPGTIPNPTGTPTTEQRPDLDLGVMLDTWKKQRQFQFAYSAESQEGKPPWEIKGYAEALGTRMTDLKTIIEEQERLALDATRAMSDRATAFALFQDATNAYYDARLEQLRVEKEKQEAVKAKSDSRINDILGTMLTHLGEVTERNGQQVIVLSAGQPDAKKLALQLKDALSGSSPELALVLQQFIEAHGKPYWG